MFIVEENGDIVLTQGDSGELKVTGIPTDRNYTLHLAVKNNRREKMFEISTTPSQGEATFIITPAMTQKLEVVPERKTQTYYYGIKICYGSYEDTLRIDSKEVGESNKITVYPLIVDGSMD